MRTRALTTAVCVVIGLMISVAAVNARGTDLRPSRSTELVDLVGTRTRANADLSRRIAVLRAEVDDLTTQGAAGEDVSAQLEQAAREAATSPVRGPGVTVTLSDAPSSVKAPETDQNLLVVHQQDIQAIVNVLWASGAEAMTIQGQRVTTTTGIKCVGNTVVLHGTPYAPPYVITAIGPPERMERALDRSDFVRIFRQYVEAYHLGYAQRREVDVELPAYAGPTSLRYAQRLGRG